MIQIVWDVTWYFMISLISNGLLIIRITWYTDQKPFKTRQIWGIWKLRLAYSPETPNSGQIRWCFVPCDLKFDGWPWKTIGHLSFAVSSFVQHFKAIGEFKLEPGNWSYSPETPNLGQIRRFLEPCDLEIWRMTLKNNRAPLLCFFKLYASFRSHRWIQAGGTVRKRPIWVKIDDF